MQIIWICSQNGVCQIILNHCAVLHKSGLFYWSQVRWVEFRHSSSHWGVVMWFHFPVSKHLLNPRRCFLSCLQQCLLSNLYGSFCPCWKLCSPGCVSAVPCKIVPQADNHFVYLAIGIRVLEISASKALLVSDGATLILLYCAYQAFCLSHPNPSWKIWVKQLI